MTSRYGLDRLVEEAAHEIGAMIYRRHDSTPGTPIEKLFATAVHTMVAVLSVTSCKIELVEPDFHPRHMPQNTEDQVADVTIVIWPQFCCLDWKVDFLLGSFPRNGRPGFVVVECDGHDFHERTKEQAAKDRSRDRRLQDAGYRIYRFTGSEIYREPMNCASEALVGLMDVSERITP